MAKQLRTYLIPTIFIGLQILLVASVDAQSELTVADFILPRTLDYEAYLDSTNGFNAASRERLASPPRFFDGPMPGSFAATDLPDTIYVRLAIVNATNRDSLNASAIDDAVADLNAIYGKLPDNDYNLRAIQFCPLIVDAPERFRFRRFGPRSSLRENPIDFSRWERYARDHEAFFEQRNIKRAVPIVIVESADDFLGFTAGARTRHVGADAVVIPRRTFQRVLRGRERSRALRACLDI